MQKHSLSKDLIHAFYQHTSKSKDKCILPSGNDILYENDKT